MRSSPPVKTGGEADDPFNDLDFVMEKMGFPRDRVFTTKDMLTWVIGPRMSRSMSQILAHDQKQWERILQEYTGFFFDDFMADWPWRRLCHKLRETDMHLMSKLGSRERRAEYLRPADELRCGVSSSPRGKSKTWSCTLVLPRVSKDAGIRFEVTAGRERERAFGSEADPNYWTLNRIEVWVLVSGRGGECLGEVWHDTIRRWVEGRLDDFRHHQQSAERSRARDEKR